MSYTQSFDASTKVTMAKLGGYLNHVQRDVNEANGIKHEYKNPNIDGMQTECNETYYRGEDGELHVCEKPKDLEWAIHRRLSKVTKKMRKDAVILRPLLLQFDPKFYKNNPDHEEMNELDIALEWAEDTFGKQNIIGVSLHMDEDAPHLHVLFCPVTEDGRVAQKDWFKGPAELRKMHDNLRQRMIDAGYDVDMMRKPKRQHMNDSEYRDYKQIEAANEELAKKEADYQRRNAQMIKTQEINNRDYDRNQADRKENERVREENERKSEELLLKEQEIAFKRKKLDKEIKSTLEVKNELETALNALKVGHLKYTNEQMNDFAERFVKDIERMEKAGKMNAEMVDKRKQTARTFQKVVNDRKKAISEVERVIRGAEEMLDKTGSRSNEFTL